MFCDSARVCVMCCTIWYRLYNLKDVKITHGEVLILVKLQASASLQISPNSALENLKFIFHKSTTGATARIITTYHLSVRQFLNQYCLFFLLFLCCLENSCFLIRFSLETKILIISLSVFCLCIHNVESLVDNCREVDNRRKQSFVVANTVVACCMHLPYLVFSRIENGLAQS